MADLIKFVEQELAAKRTNLPDFKAGDTVNVHVKISEGNKERIQEFRGDVIQLRGSGATRSFTVRNISNGVGVERVFPLFSPFVDGILVNKVGRVRRAKLFYQRNRKGKASRIQEKRQLEAPTAAAQ